MHCTTSTSHSHKALCKCTAEIPLPTTRTNGVVRCKSSRAHCPIAVHQITTINAPLLCAMGHCRSVPLQLQCLVPQGSVLVHPIRSSAHCPNVVQSRTARVLVPTTLRQCGNAEPESHFPRSPSTATLYLKTATALCIKGMRWGATTVPMPTARRHRGSVSISSTTPRPQAVKKCADTFHCSIPQGNEGCGTGFPLLSTAGQCSKIPQELHCLLLQCSAGMWHRWSTAH